MNDQAEAALSGCRVLDLTCGRGHLCGKILGDLGADVIKIEPPGGDPARRIGPYHHDIPDPEKSLFWFAFNANKRGITLNIESEDGREIFKRLAKDAHFLIESFHPGYLGTLGLDYPVLSGINPGIVMTAITPFGQDGPYKDFKGPDIVAVAMSGQMWLNGDPDRAPVRVTIPQAFLHAGTVQTSEDLFQDPQFKHGVSFRTSTIRRSAPMLTAVPGSGCRKHRGGPRRPAPCMGEHNEYVCTELLGMPDSDFIRLMQEGVFE